MAPRKSPTPKKTPKRVKREQTTEEEIEELKEYKKKTKRLISEFASFQKEVGQGLVPMQKVGLVIFTLILIGVGIYLCVWGKDAKNLDGSQDNSFITAGIILIIFAVIIFIIGYVWLNSVKDNKSLAQLNALSFEAGMVKNMFKN